MVSEESIITIRKLERALDTDTPYWRTVAGSVASTSESLFCTSTCAIFSSVSGVNVSVTVPCPLESAEVVM